MACDGQSLTGLVQLLIVRVLICVQHLGY
eukprot:SAG31_NODE_19837_length_590_cov_1.274949_1_plen_28_part_10